MFTTWMGFSFGVFLARTNVKLIVQMILNSNYSHMAWSFLENIVDCEIEREMSGGIFLSFISGLFKISYYIRQQKV